jgi:CysZ protein
MKKTFDLAKLRIGFSSYFRGYGFLFQNPKLLKYSIIPGILNCFMFIGLIILIYYNASLLVRNIMPDGNQWYMILLKIVIVIITIVVFYNVLIMLYNIISTIICGPFNSILCQKVYQTETGRELPLSPNKMLAQLMIDIEFEIKYLFYSLFKSLVLLLYLLIPVVGPFFYFIHSHIHTATILGWDHLGRPLGIMGHDFKQQKEYVYTHRSSCTGLGLAIFLLTFVPVVNLFLMPGSVSGGTLLFIHFEKCNSQGK